MAERTFVYSEQGALHLRATISLLLICAAFLVTWYLTPSNRYVSPISLAYDGERFEFIRETPRGAVWGTWRQEIRSTKGTCATEGFSFYEDVGIEPIYWVENADVSPCIPESGIFVIHVIRSVMLWEWLPLRPHSSTWTCNTKTGDCEET